MRALRVRGLTEEERGTLEKGLKSASAFTVRRCQILLTSADTGLKARQIGERLHCSDQCVRDAMHAFEGEGLACLEEKSHARHGDQRALDASGGKRLEELTKLSPRSFGYETSIWTLDLLAEQCHKEGLSERQVSRFTISRTLKQARISWRRAKHWIKSPDARYEVKKNVASG
jgi:transposase